MNHLNFKDVNQMSAYAFYWSEVRLLVAALALFLGGIPPIMLLLPIPLVATLLTLSWIISGIASVYLAYQWYAHNFRVFGGKDTIDLVAFGVLVVSGINLGIVGILGTNIGMSINSSYAAFVIVGILYLSSAGWLYKRFVGHHSHIFS